MAASNKRISIVFGGFSQPFYHPPVVKRLQDYGYGVEYKDNYAEGDVGIRLKSIVQRVVESAPDLIITADTPSSLVAKEMTQNQAKSPQHRIPIVMAICGNPEKTGLIDAT